MEEPTVERLIVTPYAIRGAKLHAQLSRDDTTYLSAAGSQHLAVERQLGSRSHLLRLARKLTLTQARALANRLQQSGELQMVEFDLLMHAQANTPDDPGYAGPPGQWNYFVPSVAHPAGLNLPGAWDITLGSASVDVAVIDSGSRPHIDLQPSLPGYDFISSTAMANDGDGRDSDAADSGDYAAAGDCGIGRPATASSWHGTHVTGTIAALMNNQRYGTGIAPGVRILPIRVLGRCGGYLSDLIDALHWAVGIDVAGVPHNANPVRVINLSLGAVGVCSVSLQNAIDEVNARGAIVVAATGNDSDVNLQQPANCNGVIAVTAHTIDGDVGDYANIGSQTTISAPGGGCGAASVACVEGQSDNGAAVYSLGNAGTTLPAEDSASLKYGTSMAVSHVVGSVALMLSLAPALTRDQIVTLLRQTARPFPAGSACALINNAGLCGAGLLDTREALVAAASAASLPQSAPAQQASVSVSTVSPMGGGGSMDNDTLLILCALLLFARHQRR
jgi:serine protease